MEEKTKRDVKRGAKTDELDNAKSTLKSTSNSETPSTAIGDAEYVVQCDRRPISRGEFEELCSLQATEEELCGWWGITPKRLNTWCRKVYRKSFPVMREMCVQDGRIRLRRISMELAIKSVQMAMNLYKALLPAREDPGRNAAMEEFIRLTAPDADAVRALFGGEAAGGFSNGGRIAGLPGTGGGDGLGVNSDGGHEMEDE